MKQIAILGSTGSIGTQTLDVVRQHSSQFSVYAISANRSVDLLIEQALEFNPAVVCIADEKYYPRLRDALSDLPIKVMAGEQAIAEMVTMPDIDVVVAAMVGYAGLASHGGTIGIFIAILMYCKKYKVKLLEVVDMICVATPFTAGCIRIGNLMNSEIVGKATGTDWGFIFAALGEDFPRHPAQLYEAIAYFTIFIISILIYKKHKDMVGSGFYFGFCLATIFTFRFFVEFCKEVQVDFEEGMALDMGQILSIPFMLIGAYFIYRGIKLKIKAKK